MNKYYFYYYRERGQVCVAKSKEDEETDINGNHHRVLEGCKWEITETEFKYASFKFLKRKYPFQ